MCGERGVVERDDRLVLDQAVVDRGRGLQPRGAHCLGEQRAVDRLHAPEVDQRRQVGTCGLRHLEDAAVDLAQAVARDRRDEVQVLLQVELVERAPAEQCRHFDVLGIAAVLVAHLVFGRVRNVHRLASTKVRRHHPVERGLFAADLGEVEERLAERQIEVHAVLAVPDRGGQQVDLGLAFAGEVGERLRVAELVELGLPEVAAGVEVPGLLVAVGRGVRVEGVVDRGVADAVAAEHDVGVDLQVQDGVVAHQRLANQVGDGVEPHVPVPHQLDRVSVVVDEAGRHLHHELIGLEIGPRRRVVALRGDLLGERRLVVRGRREERCRHCVLDLHVDDAGIGQVRRVDVDAATERVRDLGRRNRWASRP